MYVIGFYIVYVGSIVFRTLRYDFSLYTYSVEIDLLILI